MKIEEKNDENIIRYWILLQELARHKKALFPESASPQSKKWDTVKSQIDN